MIETYWDIGRQIDKAQNNNPRAEYGYSYVSNRLLMRINDENCCEFYLKGCINSNWSVMDVYYEHRKAGKVMFETKSNTEPKAEPKDLYILEFLHLKENRDYLESMLE